MHKEKHIKILYQNVYFRANQLNKILQYLENYYYLLKVHHKFAISMKITRGVLCRDCLIDIVQRNFHQRIAFIQLFLVLIEKIRSN